MTNKHLENPLYSQLSQVLPEQKRDFKRIDSATFEWCREQTTRLHVF